MSDVLLTKGIKGITDAVIYGDGTTLSLADLLTAEPAFQWPENVIRIEYLPGKRLSFFTEDGQFGPDFAFEGSWDMGDKLIAKKQQYLDAIEAAKPKPPTPPPPVDTRSGLKQALDTFLAGDGTDRAALKAVLQQWRSSLTALILVLGLAGPASAMEHYSNVAQDQNGRAIVGASITVYNAGTTTLAAIYSDDGVTPKANPFTTALDGIYDFYAQDGRYDIQITKFGYTSIYWDPAKTKGLSLFDASQFIVPYGPDFPASPTNGAFFVITSATSNGLCDSGIASGISLCRWNASLAQWESIGGGGGGGSSGLDPNFDLTGGNVITGADETKKFTLYGSGGQNTSGLVIYRHSSGKTVIKCVEAGVEGDCFVVVELNTNKKWQIKNHLGTVILEYDEATGRFTTATLDCTLAGVSCTFSDERHFPVATCQNATPSANFDVPTANTPTAACNTGTNTQKGYLAFNDSTDQAFQDHWILPTGFSAVNVSFRWKAAATSGAVGWCAQLIRVSDGTTSDQAFPAQSASNCLSDTAKGTTLQENVATITGVLCGGCGPGDHVYVRISRDADGSAVTDSMTGDALLLTYGRVFVVTQ